MRKMHHLRQIHLAEVADVVDPVDLAADVMAAAVRVDLAADAMAADVKVDLAADEVVIVADSAPDVRVDLAADEVVVIVEDEALEGVTADVAVPDMAVTVAAIAAVTVADDRIPALHSKRSVRRRELDFDLGII